MALACSGRVLAAGCPPSALGLFEVVDGDLHGLPRAQVPNVLQQQVVVRQPRVWWAAKQTGFWSSEAFEDPIVFAPCRMDMLPSKRPLLVEFRWSWTSMASKHSGHAAVRLYCIISRPKTHRRSCHQ